MLNINFIRLKDSWIEQRICYQPKYTNSSMVCDIVNCHTVDDAVIADIPEILNQDNILVLYNFLSKTVVCKGNTDFPDILERCIEIKEVPRFIKRTTSIS